MGCHKTKVILFPFPRLTDLMKSGFIFFIFVLLQINTEGQDTTRITKTDSSVIEATFYWDKDHSTGKITYKSKLVEERTYRRHLIHTTGFYYGDTAITEYDDYRDSATYALVGIGKVFDKTGNLKLTMDYDNRNWTPADTSDYPNYTLLKAMKLKGDSIVQSIYGLKFFNEHVKWNISSYYFNNGTFANEWLRDEKKGSITATEFNIRYDVYYHGGVFEEGIQIILDRNGNILPKHGWMDNGEKIYNQGFEKVDTAIHDFKLTTKQAIEIAHKYGLPAKNSYLISCDLEWNQIKDSASKIYNGNFRMVVECRKRLSKRERKKVLRGDKINSYTDYWAFNPWTGEFIKKYTVHRDHAWVTSF